MGNAEGARSRGGVYVVVGEDKEGVGVRAKMPHGAQDGGVGLRVHECARLPGKAEGRTRGSLASV
eukprot:3433304-Prymnesium_polylepis.1